MRFVVTYMCVVFPLFMFAVSLPEIESELIASVKKINYWKASPYDAHENFRSFDSLYIENNNLKTKILNYCVTHPAMLSYSFDSLRNYIDVATSDDNKFRIYSWWIGEKDKMEYFVNIFQYEAQGKVYSTMINYDDEYDPKGYYSEIHSLQLGGDTTIYMGYFHAFYTPKDFSHSYQTFQIVGQELQDSIPLFKMNDSIMSSIEVLFHPVSQSRFTKKLLFYNPKKQQIKIRQTDNFGMILSSYKKLVFNGRYFEYIE